MATARALLLALSFVAATAWLGFWTAPRADRDRALAPLVRDAPINQPKPMAPLTGGSNVNVSQLAGNEAEVGIDVNPQNPDNQVIFGYAPNAVVINSFYTFDGGQTWTLNTIDQSDDGLNGFLRGDPSLAFDEDGNLYLCYGVRIGGPNRITIVVVKSTNGGQSYSQLTYVHTNLDIDSIPGDDKWHVTTGPDPELPSRQNVYVTWTWSVSEAPTIDQRVAIARSIDGGASFSAPTIVNDASIDGTSPGNIYIDPAVGPDGRVYVAWWNVGTGQILVDAALGGVGFGEDVVISTSQIGFKEPIPAQPDRGIFAGPSIDVDRSIGPFGGRAYVVYADFGATGNPDADVFVQFSDDGAQTWSVRTRVNDDAGLSSQFLPWLDVDQKTGVVGAAWYDTREDIVDRRVHVYLAASADGGASFDTNIRLTDAYSDQSANNPAAWVGNYLEYIGLAIDDREAYAVWADNSTDLTDLDYFTDSRTLATTGVVDVASAGGQPAMRLAPNVPNPFRTSTRIGFELAIAGAVRLGVYDVQGRSVRLLAEGERRAGRHDVEWDAADASGARVAAGIYLVRLEAAGMTQTRKLLVVE